MPHSLAFKQKFLLFVYSHLLLFLELNTIILIFLIIFNVQASHLSLGTYKGK